MRFAVERGAGFGIIYAPELEDLRDESLADAGRALMDLLTELAVEAGASSPQDALRLAGRLVALAHGYATLLRDGFYTRGTGGTRYSLDDIAARAVQAAREPAAASSPRE
ncbi:WHG domain-containing protein [Streptomyces sp. SD15]